MAIEVLLWCVLALVATAPAAVAGVRHRGTTTLVYAIALVVSAIALVTAAWVLVTDVGLVQTVRLPFGLPWLGTHFRLDSLAAAFLVVVNFGGATASLYGLGYGQHEEEPGRVLPFFPAFLGGMNLVVLADDAFTFLLTWEFMSLTSWALVMAHHRQAGNARAGYIYLLMASFGTLSLLLSFGLLAGPSRRLRVRRDPRRATADGRRLRGPRPGPARRRLQGRSRATACLATARASGGAQSRVRAHERGHDQGCGVRLHSHRVRSPGPARPGGRARVVLLFGGASAVLGVLHALMEHDLKRLLAYHTVENIGIIFIGLGLAPCLSPPTTCRGRPRWRLTAALFHVFNHSVFKSLLFFGSGAVLTATGERDMERLGGLIHRMPHTAFAFLVGSAAISALPPFNGFVSEWLTFQAILLSPQLPQWVLKFLVPAVGGLLALSAALAAACFVKAFGITFLGRAANGRRARRPAKPTRFSLATMFVLVVTCLVAGVLPGYFIDALAPVVEGAGRRAHAAAGGAPVADDRARRREPQLVQRIAAVRADRRRGEPHRICDPPLGLARHPASAAWDCGFPDATPATQYTAGSFAQPIRRVFGTAGISRA